MADVLGDRVATALKDHRPSPGLWPTQWIPAHLEDARRKHATAIAEQLAWQAGQGADGALPVGV